MKNILSSEVFLINRRRNYFYIDHSFSINYYFSLTVCGEKELLFGRIFGIRDLKVLHVLRSPKP